MGAVNQVFECSGRIDFAAVSNAAQSALISLVQEWLPDGKREGSEWVARNPTRGDTRPGSFKINLSTGVWSDFATGEAGGDAIDLLAYLNRTSKLDAAREIAQRLGVTSGTASTFRPIQSTKPTPPLVDLNVAPTFPARTHPDKNGKPRFVVAGEEGPRVPEKGDVSDWIEAGHTTDDLLARVDATPVLTSRADEMGSESKEETGVSVLPYGYKFTDRGLMWLNPDDDDKPPMLIAGHFDILAETRDGEGGSWGLLLRWKDHDGREHRYALPRAMLAGDGSEARRALLDGGHVHCTQC